MSAPLQLLHLSAFDESMAQAETVHRQLRPELPADYATAMRRVFADGGQVLLARRGGEVVGLALYRMLHTTRCFRFYVDDLVTDLARRSEGIGAILMQHLEERALQVGAQTIELESGLSRERTHRFYERQGFERFAVSFRKAVRATR